MKRSIIIVIFFLSAFFASAHAHALWQKFERSAFYHAMASDDIKQVDAELAELAGAPGHDGYEGALLMRKAGLVKHPKEKLALFKEGRIKFQTGYEADSTNAELHFLRLTIQEHAPKMVKYHNDIEADKRYVKTHFNTMSPAAQHAVVEYAKTSAILRSEDF